MSITSAAHTGNRLSFLSCLTSPLPYQHQLPLEALFLDSLLKESKLRQLHYTNFNTFQFHLIDQLAACDPESPHLSWKLSCHWIFRIWHSPGFRLPHRLILLLLPFILEYLRLWPPYHWSQVSTIFSSFPSDSHLSNSSQASFLNSRLTLDVN